MENIFLLAAVLLTGTAAVLSFIPRFHAKTIIKAIWTASVAFILTDLLLMFCYLVQGRFEYLYVSGHTNASLPMAYRISALWAGQEGSFLLWSAVLAVVGFFVLRIKGKNAEKILGIFALICFSIFFMCLVSQPFLKQEPASLDGAGLPQALQDPWMVLHPPLVFIAYSAMGVLAALAAGITSERDAQTEKRIIWWMRVSWLFLGLGIFTGSIWAYRALGWGGYWAWDPIENAALIPWLILCGYLHNKKKISRLRCALPFIIACLGTLLTRSGLLKGQSAHAYAAGNTAVSIAILAFLAGLLCWLLVIKIKSKEKKEHLRFKELCMDKKQCFILLLYAYALLIALGTVTPLFTGITTPLAYYAAISIAFAVCYSGLLIGSDTGTLKRKNGWMLAISTAIAGGIVATARSAGFGWILLLWVCLMPPALFIASGFKGHSAGYYLIHIGIALLVAGVITTSGFGREAIVIEKATAASVTIEGSSLMMDTLMNEDSLIVSMPGGDVIVACDQMITLPDGTIAIPYQTKPLILLFWTGGFLTILGFAAAVSIKKISAKLIKKQT